MSKLIVTVLAASSLFVFLPASPANSDPICTQAQITAGTCVSGTIEGDAAVLEGSQPGTPGNGSTNSGASSGPEEPECRDSSCVDRGVFTMTSLPVPTLSDIAAFRPSPGTDHMEPNGWFVVGLDANFYATGGSSVVGGTLLGYPADVRFTPIRWRWTYGDGTSATKSTRGNTWSALGIAEFDPTPTSHVYDEAGTYYIDLTIGYRAEYSFDGSAFATIQGTLWLPANRLVATVGSAKTVLVERDCTVSPAGPGCSN